MNKCKFLVQKMTSKFSLLDPLSREMKIINEWVKIIFVLEPNLKSFETKPCLKSSLTSRLIANKNLVFRINEKKVDYTIGLRAFCSNEGYIRLIEEFFDFFLELERGLGLSGNLSVYKREDYIAEEKDYLIIDEYFGRVSPFVKALVLRKSEPYSLKNIMEINYQYHAVCHDFFKLIHYDEIIVKEYQLSYRSDDSFKSSLIEFQVREDDFFEVLFYIEILQSSMNYFVFGSSRPMSGFKDAPTKSFLDFKYLVVERYFDFALFEEDDYKIDDAVSYIKENIKQYRPDVKEIVRNDKNFFGGFTAPYIIITDEGEYHHDMREHVEIFKMALFKLNYKRE